MDLDRGWYQATRMLESALNKAFAVDDRAILEFDSVLSVDDMNALGYARNFPHLTCVMCSLVEENLPSYSKGETHLVRGAQAMNADFALLPATCYKIYLSLRGRHLDQEQLIGCIAKCFRHEDKPLDSYRSINFTMKEFVHIGTAESAQAHLDRGARRIDGIARHLGLAYEVDAASDPFFDTSSSVAVMSRLMPTKREILFDGHAVSSLNYHRNYFGEKFDIRLNDQPVHTSCVAFGMERWGAMLAQRFGTVNAAADALETLGLGLQENGGRFK
jgi:seryl-tRNA synthetase